MRSGESFGSDVRQTLNETPLYAYVVLPAMGLFLFLLSWWNLRHRKATPGQFLTYGSFPEWGAPYLMAIGGAKFRELI